MALGAEAFITAGTGTKRQYASNDQLRIPPGQFGILITEEEVSIPPNMLAFISIKASKKMNGLVNVSGFHVDPGFKGRLKFSVYNAGPEAIVLDVGRPLFPIWFYELGEADENPYAGIHQGQSSISSDDVSRLQGDLASPAALKKQLDDLHASVTNWKAATVGALLTAIATALAAIIGAFVRR
jgi:dCTP deaminase